MRALISVYLAELFQFIVSVMAVRHLGCLFLIEIVALLKLQRNLDWKDPLAIIWSNPLLKTDPVLDKIAPGFDLKITRVSGDSTACFPVPAFSSLLCLLLSLILLLFPSENGFSPPSC